MAGRIRTDVHLCQLLPQQNGLSSANLASLRKDQKLSRFNEQTLISIITSLFIQAIGIDQVPKVMGDAFPLKDHPGFYPEFFSQIQRIGIVLALIQEKKNPLADTSWHSYLEAGNYEVSTATQRAKQWTARSIWAMSTPLYVLRQAPTPKEVLEIANDYEEEVTHLALFLYDQLSDAPKALKYTSFNLLNLYHSVALMSPQGPITWGVLVQAYRDHVPDDHHRAETLLKDYPFPVLHQALGVSFPLPSRDTYPHQSFREFVIQLTLDVMELFLEHSLTSTVSDQLIQAFKNNESFRRTFSLFMPNPTIPPTDVEENMKPLIQAYRMTYHLVHLHIPAEERGSIEGKQIFEWALSSNRTNVMRIDQYDYQGPKPANPCHPKTVVPMTLSLKALYHKNGELFAPHAFSLLMLLTSLQDRSEEFATFLIKCNCFRPFAVTTYQVLQYSHFKEHIETTEDLSYLEGLQKVIPEGLQGSSTKGFDLFLMRLDLPISQRLERIETFNLLLHIHSPKPIDPHLYFEAVAHFLTGRITEYHLAIFDLYHDEYPHMPIDHKLDLLIRATAKEAQPRYVYQEGSSEPDREASDPYFLFQALKLLDPKKEKRLREVIALFQTKFLGGRSLHPSSIKSLRTHFLSSIPSVPSREHVDYVIDRMKSLGHHFSEAHQLRVFYELLSLETNRVQIHFNVEFIKLLESFTHNKQKMAPNTVAHFLAYHPHLSVEQTRQLRFHFDQLVKHREACMTESILGAPLLPEVAVEAIFGNALEIQEILEDKQRALALLKESKIWMTIVAPLINYLYFGSIPLSVRHVTATLPTTLPHRGSPNQALMPLVIQQDLGKQFYGSWERENDSYVFRFSVVTKDEKVSHAGKALFPIDPQIFDQNPALPFLLKTFVYYLGYDGAIRNRETNLETVKGFLQHPNVAGAWNTFSPIVGDKGEIGHALFSFCQHLRIGLRQAFLNLATNHKYDGAELSSGRIEFDHLPKMAAKGDTLSKGSYHLLVPYELVDGSLEELTCYGTYHETHRLLNRDHSRVDNAIKRYDIHEIHPASLNIQVNHGPVLLPLTVEGKQQVIDYNDKEYKKLEGEEDAYKTEGYALTLSTEINDSPLSVRVIYTAYDLYTRDTFRPALSWHIAQLKARIYEKIISLSVQEEK